APTITDRTPVTLSPTPAGKDESLPEFVAGAESLDQEAAADGAEASEPEAAEDTNRFVPGLTLYNDGTYSRISDAPAVEAAPAEKPARKRKRQPENFDELP